MKNVTRQLSQELMINIKEKRLSMTVIVSEFLSAVY